MLHFKDERYTLYEDRLEPLQQIVAEADDSDEAREETIEFARQQADRE